MSDSPIGLTAAAWHDDPAFWEAVAPIDFDQARWQRAVTEVDHLLTLARVAPNSTVLDLGCGPGRHALELSRRGHAVTGVDRTTALLAEAKRRAAAERLVLDWVHADMREFVRPEAFDLALSMFTSFAYFDDPRMDRQVLVNASRSLRPGGTLVVETLAKEVVARTFRERGWTEREGVMVVEERRIMLDWADIETRWIILRADRRQEVRFRIRLYSATELATLLRDVGFLTVDVYGDLTGAPFDHTAKGLVAIARR